MLILAVETSGSPGSIALVRDGECLEERVLPEAGRRHAQTLVNEVAAVFNQFGMRAGGCNLVAVSGGPGSFTGLRVGVVFAKSFAYATGCPVVMVDTFHGIAAACPADVTQVSVIGDAQRGELFVGTYRQAAPGLWQPAQEISIQNADVWCSARRADDVVTGPAVSRNEGELSSRCRVLPAEYHHPRAVWIARLAQRQLVQCGTDDVWSLEPKYLRTSAAEEKWAATRPAKGS